MSTRALGSSLAHEQGHNRLLLLKLVAPTGVRLGPDTDALRGREEVGPAVVADSDFALVPAEDVGPLLAGMLLAHVDALLALTSAVADDSDRAVVVRVTLAEPGDAVGWQCQLGDKATLTRMDLGG